MGIRESLRQKPATAIAIGAGLVLLGGAIAAIQVSTGANSAAAPGDRAFYSTDDGQTWFPDAAEKTVPFDHDGRPAVRAYVYESHGKQFVNHLERLTPESQKKLAAFTEAMRSGKPTPPVAELMTMRQTEVKKPGAPDWTPTKSPKSTPITHPAPDAKPVTP